MKLRYNRVIVLFLTLMIAGIGPVFGADEEMGNNADTKGRKTRIIPVGTVDPQGTLGNVTAEQILDLANNAAIASMQRKHISSSRRISYLFPGWGQFKNDETLAGAIFLVSDLLVISGTLVGAYFLLPDDVRFANLDYINEPFADIKETWVAHSFKDYLPTFAVLAGGKIARTALRFFSSAHAGRAAEQNIEDGTITFDPVFEIGDDGLLSMKMSY
jgi:hypothetical protein